MPPVDRRNPIRAASSESTCNLVEFFREFPDEKAPYRLVCCGYGASGAAYAKHPLTYGRYESQSIGFPAPQGCGSERPQ
jgi:hypothetical protein